MRIKGAMTVLNRRAKFYGKTLDWLINAIDQGMDENMTVTQAYEVIKWIKDMFGVVSMVLIGLSGRRYNGMRHL